MKTGDIRIRGAAPREGGGARLPLIYLLFLIAAEWGLLILIDAQNGALGPDISVALVYVPAMLYMSVLFLVWRRKRSAAWAMMLVSLVIMILLAYRRRSSIVADAAAVVSAFNGAALPWSAAFGRNMLLFAIGAALLVFIAEIVLCLHVPASLVVIAAVIAVSVLDVKVPAASLVCWCIYITGFMARRRTGPGKRKLVPDGEARLRIASSGGAAALILALLTALLAAPLGAVERDAVYSAVDRIDDKITDILDELRDSSGEPHSSGSIATGNDYKNGRTELVLTTEARPDQVLYLRGFYGERYSEGTFLPEDREALRDRFTEGGNDPWMLERVDFIYYDLMLHVPELHEPEFINLRHANGRYGQVFQPYYSILSYDPASGEGLDMENNGYNYYYMDQAEFSWKDVEVDYQGMAQWYRKIEADYERAIGGECASVPQGTAPRFEELAIPDFDKDKDLDRITAFIAWTLQSNTEYTLRPGLTPSDHDPLEYFLFDSGKGYCQHYAGAATLLYRRFGVPARYASGYVARPSDFYQQDDGTYRAELTDREAHSWAEIFIRGYGWVPVDMTPDKYGNPAVTYPGFTHDDFMQVMWEEGWKMSVSSFGKEREGIPAGRGAVDTAAMAEILSLLAAAALAVTVISGLRHRRTALACLRENDARGIFGRLLDACHAADVMKGYGGNEADFPAACDAQLGTLAVRRAAHWQSIVQSLVYGDIMPSDEDTAELAHDYDMVSWSLYWGLPWWRKPLFAMVYLRRRRVHTALRPHERRPSGALRSPPELRKP